MLKRLSIASLLCLGIYINANTTDMLESAIKNSDVEAVKKNLASAQLAENQFIQLVDLAQQIINQRKSEWECFQIRPIVPPEESKRSGTCIKSFSAGAVSTLIVFIIDKYVVKKNLVKLLKQNIDTLGIGFFAASVGFIFIFLINAIADQKAWEKKLKKLYDNAIEIKSLIMKSYNPTFATR